MNITIAKLKFIKLSIKMTKIAMFLLEYHTKQNNERIFADISSHTWGLKGAECVHLVDLVKSSLINIDLLSKIGVDVAENEPHNLEVIPDCM